MSEYMQNQMDNLIQSGISERENMIANLEKWQSIAKELAEKLEHLLELHSVEQEALRPPTPMMWYNATVEGSDALQTYKTLTNEN